MKTLADAWSNVLEYLQNQEDISITGFDTWIKRIEPHGIHDGDVVLYVQTNFQRNIIMEYYAPKLNEALESVLGVPMGLKILSKQQDAQVSDAAFSGANPDNASSSPEIMVDYEFSFDNFIVGSANKFAHAASYAVASNPAGHYNPLFIYGGSGLGKTHLMLAIKNEIEKNDPSSNIMYTKGEYIANELIEAIQTGTTADFRSKYRLVDVLLVDDIQFIAGKTSTQEEFFHTFDALHQAKKQIVLTSDRPPKEISTLEERLRNRFEMGLIADIQPPDLELRIAIVRKKAELLDIDLSDEVCEYIASQLKSNVRQLEGAVRGIRAQTLLGGEQPGMLAAQNAIRDIRADSQPTPITVDRIVNEVSRTMNVSADDIRSSKRAAPISLARQVSAYSIQKITNLSMKAIGEDLGDRDHSTIVYAIQRVEERMEQDPSFKGMVSDIIKNIKG